VPTNPDACGLEARKTLPQIEQIYVTAPDYMDAAEFNRNLFVARRKTELALRENDAEFYVNTLSADVILYKGLMMPRSILLAVTATGLMLAHQSFTVNCCPN